VRKRTLRNRLVSKKVSTTFEDLNDYEN
jgi:hypothetical protein